MHEIYKSSIIMVKNVEFNAAQRTADLGVYETPEVKIALIQPEGVLCSSVYNNHQGFDFDEVEDL
jgi:hypothetical protein